MKNDERNLTLDFWIVFFQIEFFSSRRFYFPHQEKELNSWEVRVYLSHIPSSRNWESEEFIKNLSDYQKFLERFFNIFYRKLDVRKYEERIFIVKSNAKNWEKNLWNGENNLIFFFLGKISEKKYFHKIHKYFSKKRFCCSFWFLSQKKDPVQKFW